MKLYIQYLYRELLADANNQNRRTVINDRQRVFDNYACVLEFNTDGIDEAALKREISNAVIESYGLHENDSVQRLAYPDAEANCIACRFEGEDENFGENVFLQRNGEGWKYYNFPPFGKKRTNLLLIDARTVIDDLLRKVNVGNRITRFTIRYNNESWCFFYPDLDGSCLKADELQISLENENYLIYNPVFVLPYSTSAAWDGRANVQCTSFTTLFAIILKGECEWDSYHLKLDLSDVLRRFTPYGEMYYSFSGSIDLSIEDEMGEYAVDEYTGEMYSSRFVSDDEYKNGRLLKILNISLLYARLDENDIDLQSKLYTVSTDMSELGNPDRIIDKQHIAVRDLLSGEEYSASILNNSLKLAKAKTFRTYEEVKEVEAILFSDKSPIIKYSDYYENGYYYWTLEYETEKTRITALFVGDLFLSGGINVKRVVINSKSGTDGNDHPLISAGYDLDGESVLQSNLKISEALDSNILPDRYEDRLNDAKHLDDIHDVFDYFENDLYEALADSDRLAENLSKSKNTGYSVLERVLSFDNNRTLSFSNETLEEIALSITEWIPIIEKANEEGISVRKYLLNNENIETPVPTPLAILGEAGTGKTTLARMITERCLGANMKTVLSNDLKGMYVNWGRARFAKLIWELQKDSPENIPSVLFIDEAYTLFEADKKDAKFVGDTIELLLKLLEPGEYDIDLSEISDKNLEEIGLLLKMKTVPEQYNDEVLYSIKHDSENGYYIVRVKNVRKRRNTVIWIGGYEERLLKSFVTNEGLQRRFRRQIVIPTPKMNELMKMFKEEIKKIGAISEASEKIVKNFLTWATSRSRSHLFGNYAGIIETVERCKDEFALFGDVDYAVADAVKRYKAQLEKRYKAELIKDVTVSPFEVVTQVNETLDDYAGNEQLKRRIRGIIDIMLKKEEYEKKHISLPKGALLMGPPGTGKTMIARCMAGELAKRIAEEAIEKNQKDVAFIPTSAAELLASPNPVESISYLFAEASGYDACIVFIDEIDAIGKRRELQNNAGPLTQLMKEIDGFSSSGTVFVIAATNDPDILDPALVRDNRFDIRLEVGRPDKTSSIALIRYYLSVYEIDYNDLSKELQEKTLSYLGGRVPAFVRANLNEAAILYHQSEMMMLGKTDEEIAENYRTELAHRRSSDGTYQRSEKYDGSISDYGLFLLDLKEVIDIKEIGSRKENDKEEEFTTEPDRNGNDSSVAIHEVGHAIVGLELDCLNIERITILGRGDAAGYVEHKRNSGNLITKQDFLNEIMISMGGRVAEELIYGPDNISCGAVSDIEKSSRLARNMVAVYGFSDEIGFMAVGEYKGKYLGTEFCYMVGDKLRDCAEEEQNKILKSCMEKTRKILKENKELLLQIARELFDKKEITGEEMEKIYADATGKRQIN